MAYEKLKQMIQESSRIVFFGGAGVSTESGIPDFRGVDGLYHQKYDVPPETILSHSYFVRYPEKFYRFYRDKMLVTDVSPNAAHRALARLEQEGKLLAVVTQNIDGLHQAAGSRTVYELHGSIHRNYCLSCGKKYTAQDLQAMDSLVPRCSCGGMIRPEVVLYEEGLDQDTLNAAVHAIRSADMMIVAGTSLTVYPAAGLVTYFRGKHLVLINRDATPMDASCDLVIHDRVGQVLKDAVGL